MLLIAQALTCAFFGASIRTQPLMYIVDIQFLRRYFGFYLYFFGENKRGY
jgi:hypothetical protein